MRSLIFTFLVSGLIFNGGCSVVEFVKPEGAPSNEQISYGYELSRLKRSDAAEVLAVIELPEYELLSQSESVLASYGDKKDGYKSWLKMVAFDEDLLTAVRKYLLIEDERPKILFTEPVAYASLDCAMLIDEDFFYEPYADENARRIAVLEYMLEMVRSDIAEVKKDNQMISVYGMIISQGFESALRRLKDSPAEAARLDRPEGVAFSTMSYSRGRIGLVIEDYTAIVKMRLGSKGRESKFKKP